MEYRTPDEPHSSLAWAWRAALAFFVLAASMGALYRFGLAYGWTAGLNLVHIRHAHSHTMFFGWVTPVLFALIARLVPRRGQLSGTRAMRWILIGCFAAASVSYPLFLAFGYSLVALGDANMPIAVIGSTLNMIAWWAFAVWYARGTRGVARGHGQRLVDLSIVFLVLATSGAIGLALLKPLGINSDVWSAALTHVFVDYFSEGWFVVGLLGMAHLALRGDRNGPGWSLVLLCVGLPLSFALGMPSTLVPPGLALLARAGGTLVAIALIANVAYLWPATAEASRRMWRVPLALLFFKSLAQLTGTAVPGVWWADVHGMRVLYLHLMLLGYVTLGLFAAANGVWRQDLSAGRRAMNAAVILVLLTLVPLTPAWPGIWMGRWIWVVAAWASLAPVTVAVYALLHRGSTHPHPDPLPTST